MRNSNIVLVVVGCFCVGMALFLSSCYHQCVLVDFLRSLSSIFLPIDKKPNAFSSSFFIAFLVLEFGHLSKTFRVVPLRLILIN